MMQGYSDQEYQLTNSSYDEKNKVTLIDMEIFLTQDQYKLRGELKSQKIDFLLLIF